MRLRSTSTLSQCPGTCQHAKKRDWIQRVRPAGDGPPAEATEHPLPRRFSPAKTRACKSQPQEWKYPLGRSSFDTPPNESTRIPGTKQAANSASLQASNAGHNGNQHLDRDFPPLIPIAHPHAQGRRRAGKEKLGCTQGRVCASPIFQPLDYSPIRGTGT